MLSIYSNILRAKDDRDDNPLYKNAIEVGVNKPLPSDENFIITGDSFVIPGMK